jgi:hypothetical protein
MSNTHTETWVHDGESFNYGVNLIDQTTMEVFFDQWSLRPPNHAMVTWPTAKDAWLYYCEEVPAPDRYDQFCQDLNEAYEMLTMMKQLTDATGPSADEVAKVVTFWVRFAKALASLTGAETNIPASLTDFDASKLPTAETCQAVRTAVMQIPAHADAAGLKREIVGFTGLAAVMKVVPKTAPMLDSFRRDVETELHGIAGRL